MAVRARGWRRFDLWKRLLWKRGLKIMGPVYGGLNGLSAGSERFLAATANVLPAWLQQRLAGWVDVVGAVPWYWWALGWSVLLLALVLEGSYQVVSRLEDREERRGASPDFEGELHRLLTLLVTEIQQQMGVSRTNHPERYYLDEVLRHIRDHRREGAYRELVEALQELSIAFGRVVSFRPPTAPPNRIFGMMAPMYERQAQAALDVIHGIIGNV
jgi:hypothetical protein